VGSLEEFAAVRADEEPSFENAVGQDSLTRFDRPNQNRGRKKNRNKRRNQKKTKGPAKNA
jgi:hypothetical protein